MENYRGINADSISVEDSNAFGSLTGSHFLQPIEGWTVTDVVQWLEENGFGRFCELFIKHDITGDVLLDLNYTYLKDMGVNLVGDRARILQAIKQKLRPPRPATIIDPNIVVPSFNGDRSILQMPGKMNQRPRNASLRDYADGGAVFPDLIMDSHIFSPISRNSTPERAATPEQSADLASSSASGKASTGQADYPSSHNAFSGIAPYTVKKSPSSGMIIPQTSLLETPLQQPESYQSDNGGPIQPSYVRSFSRAKSNPSLVSPVLTIAPRSSSIKAADNPSQPVDDSPPTQTASEPSNGPPLSPGREIYIQLFGEQEGNRMSDKTRNRAVQISPPVKKPSFIRVQGLNGEWVSVNIAGAVDGIQIRDTIYAAFNITDERSKDEYVIFRKEISSSGSLISQPSDIELERMCQKRDNNEQLQLQFIIRKKILGRDTTVGRSSNLRVEQRKESLIDAEDTMLDRSIIKLQNFFGETLAPPSPQNSTKPNNRQSVVLQPRDIGERSAKKLSKFFGERPPDDLIVDQLEEFFPGISIDMLKPGNRSSTIKDMVQNAILNKRMSRASVRHSARSDRVSRISQGQSPGRPTSRRLQELEDDYRAPLSSMTSSEYERGPKDFELDDWLSEVKQIASSDGDRSSSGLEPTIHWQKGALIGQGAFGKVYHALNLDTGEIMAVKQVLLGPENKSRKKKEDALQREIELLQDLNHEHIVRYLGAEASDTSFNVFLEYVSGGSISSVLRKFGRFDEELVQTMTVQILYGLEYLHDRNIIHRDIKGANVLIDSDGIAKISDFGISKKNEYQTAYQRVTRMSMQGSINWMAVEVARGKGYSAKVDIWSLGCLVIEMLTGHPPWHNAQGNIIYLLGTGNAPPIPEELSEMARDFVSKCFIIDPELRPTATELLSHPWTLIDPYAFDFQKWESQKQVMATTDTYQTTDTTNTDSSLF